MFKIKNQNMKKIGLFIFFVCSFSFAKSQCIDAIITTSNDTIYGRLLDTTNEIYTFDSYNHVFAIHQNAVKEHIRCIRQATTEDLARFKQLDNLSDKDLQKNTPGYYLRKSTSNFYVGSCMLAGGLTINTLAFTYFNENYPKSKYPLFALGSAATAGGIFFLLRSFYFIDKAGKLMDLDRSTIYLESNKDGHLSIKWKF